MYKGVQCPKVTLVFSFFLHFANPIAGSNQLNSEFTLTNTANGLEALDGPASDVQGKREENLILIITEDKEVTILQEGDEIFSETFPDLLFPKISAIYETARMKVINNTAYIGSFNGTIHKLQISVDAGNISVNKSTVELTLPCTTEVFTNDGPNVSAACFAYKINMLYFVNVHSPSEKSELSFSHASDLSNILNVKNVFYFTQTNNLFKADTNSQPRVVEKLQDCIQPKLIKHKYCGIIIHCQNTSIFYIPEEWDSCGIPGIYYGPWEDKKVFPCHNTGVAPRTFSSNGTAITFYDHRNDFQKTVQLNGKADVNTITCAWINDDIVLVYKENQECNCWWQYTLNNRLEYKNSVILLSAHGKLHPLSTRKGDVDQKVLQFYPDDNLQYLLLPSENQTLLDLKTGFSYGDITNRVVLYNGMIFDHPKSEGGGTRKKTPIDKSSEESDSWVNHVIVVVVIIVVFITLILVAILGSVSYRACKRRHGNAVMLRTPTQGTHGLSPTSSLSTIEDTQRSSSAEDMQRPSPAEDTERSSPVEDTCRTEERDSEKSNPPEINYTDNHRIITQATETDLNSLV